MNLQKNVLLAPLTTIKLGGAAQEYISCTSTEEIIPALQYAKEKNLRVHVLGGGSNTIFPDTGFTGLTIHMQTKGITHEDQADGTTLLLAQAGENWDAVVQYAIEHDLAGIECLSGIPGSCGGTPFQNVGAYGQDVSETIRTVHAINRATLAQEDFSSRECGFGYRTSRFKEQDRDRYIITAVVFALVKRGAPKLVYPELQAAFASAQNEASADQNNIQLVRDAVLALRKKKSMLIDPQDPNSVSCGSFFTNPIIPKKEFTENQTLLQSNIPNFPEKNNCVKLSAGWLIEHAGFAKGMRVGNVGISDNHSLALVNRGGTAQELLAFAKTIQDAVQEKFDIRLELEPIVVSSS